MILQFLASEKISNFSCIKTLRLLVPWPGHSEESWGAQRIDHRSPPHHRCNPMALFLKKVGDQIPTRKLMAGDVEQAQIWHQVSLKHLHRFLSKQVHACKMQKRTDIFEAALSEASREHAAAPTSTVVEGTGSTRSNLKIKLIAMDVPSFRCRRSLGSIGNFLETPGRKMWHSHTKTRPGLNVWPSFSNLLSCPWLESPDRFATAPVLMDWAMMSLSIPSTCVESTTFFLDNRHPQQSQKTMARYVKYSHLLRACNLVNSCKFPYVGFNFGSWQIKTTAAAV